MFTHIKFLTLLLPDFDDVGLQEKALKGTINQLGQHLAISFMNTTTIPTKIIKLSPLPPPPPQLDLEQLVGSSRSLFLS